jgi:hypothetical protein
MSLAKADMQIAALYADLVDDAALAMRILALIQLEYERTRERILLVTRHQELMENEAVVQRSIQLRNPYVDPLNYLQVMLLKRLRSLPDPEGKEAEALREAMQLTINGIAAGLRNTGWMDELMEPPRLQEHGEKILGRGKLFQKNNSKQFEEKGISNPQAAGRWRTGNPGGCQGGGGFVK